MRRPRWSRWGRRVARASGCHGGRGLGAHTRGSRPRRVQAFPAVMGLLRDRDLPVRVQAAITIKELVEQQSLFTDTWQGKFEELKELAKSNGTPLAAILEIQDRKVGAK